MLPDRSQITMTTPFMRAYTELLVSTCHRRGAHAIGGMAAFVPNKANPAVTEQALAKVKADKEREAADGFDGSWVAHPGLVPTCIEAFTAVLGDRPNQLDKQRPDVHVTAADLLAVGSAARHASRWPGCSTNISVALRYLTAWVSGQGAVAIDNLMEDAATVEISRTQIWQWLHHKTKLAEGLVVTPELVNELVGHEVDRLHRAGHRRPRPPARQRGEGRLHRVGAGRGPARVLHPVRLRPVPDRQAAAAHRAAAPRTTCGCPSGSRATRTPASRPDLAVFGHDELSADGPGRPSRGRPGPFASGPSITVG